MRAPLVLCEGDDIMFFHNTDDAESFFEPWYVENETFQLYDSDARPLCVSVAGRRVLISDAPTAAPCIPELKSRLQSFLLACRQFPAAEITGANLAQLIALGTSVERTAFPEIHENTDQDGWPKAARWMHCRVVDYVWTGAGDDTKLERLLETFLLWADKAGS